MVNPDYTGRIRRSEAAGNWLWRLLFYFPTSWGRLTHIVRISWFGFVILNLSFYKEGVSDGENDYPSATTILHHKRFTKIRRYT